MGQFRDTSWDGYHEGPGLSVVFDIPESPYPLVAPRATTLEMSTSEITLQIGPVVLTIESRTSTMTKIVNQHFKDFSSDPGDSPLRLICDSKPAPTINALLPADGRLIERRASYWVLRTKNFEATYFPRYRMAWAAIPENIHHLRTLLEMLFSLWLTERGSILLRGLAVAHHKKAFLLMDALDESGDDRSTTTTGLLQNETSILTRSARGTHRIHGTPLGGDDLTGAKIPAASMAGIIFVSNAKGSGLRPMTPEKAVPHLLRQAVDFVEDQARTAELRNWLHRLVHRVPVYELPGRENLQFWKLIKEQRRPGHPTDPLTRMVSVPETSNRLHVEESC
jgi:hypothetical protein